MTKRRFFSTGLALLSLGLILGMAAPAAAADDPMLTKPVVLLIIDTSGSMMFGLENGYHYSGWPHNASTVIEEPLLPMSCGKDGNLKCNRMQIVVEALTGSYTQEGTPPWQASYCNASQVQDGILDNYRNSVRFALASFDGEYDDYQYGNPSYKYGIKPRNGDGCSGNTCLVDFLDKNNPTDTVGHNDSLETKICSYRGEYGVGTPLGVALNDANWYMHNWQDEIDYTDKFWECRPKYVILFTDGNETTFEAGAGNVIQNAQNIFDNTIQNYLPELYWPGKTQGVPVFLVGMGNRDDYNADPGSYPIDIGVLDEAAQKGSGNKIPQAFIADNAVELRAQFDAILSIIMSGSSSRTDLSSQPSMAAVNKGYQFKAYFDVSEAGPWEGHLVREEITDLDGDGVPEYVGDPMLFEDKLADQNPTDRNIYSIYDDPRSQAEGLFRDMDLFKNGVRASPAGGDDSLMCLPSSPRLPSAGDDVDVSEAEYADYVKDFMRGVTGKKNINKTWETDGQPWLGDIFHASPVVVAPPSSLAPDFHYEAYYLANQNRPTMVYAGANDGMLHAFVGEDIDDPTRDGKELWGFVPNKTLSIVQHLRGLHRGYIDSTPVVRDVFFNELPTEVTGGLPEPGYRTVLIGGVRGGGNFYYALDVTEPEHPRYLWEYRTAITPDSDYTDPAVQCKQDIAESWAKPIIGQIWVRLPNDEYQARSVAIVPGGFLPGAAFGSISTCIELIEMTVFPSTMHVIDIETGKLLKRYSFTNDGVYDSMMSTLEDYYEKMASGDENPWNKYTGQCDAFKTEDYDPDTNTGWGCAEKRANLQNPPGAPDALKVDEFCWECPVSDGASDEDKDVCDTLAADGVTYAKICCANPTKMDVCIECDDDGDCDNGHDFYCHDHKCTKRDVDVDCDQDCGDTGDPPCSDCDDGECQDPATCTTDITWGDCDKQEVTVASRCDSPDMSDLNKVKNCSWRYMEYADGSKDHWLKTEGCFLVPNDERGRLCYHVGGNFNVNGVAAHPAAYNSSFGEFITRAFMPTTSGKIWRLDMGNGLLDLENADEGFMIESYQDDSSGAELTYQWDTTEFFDVAQAEDPLNKPNLIPGRPVMAPPALALSYSNSLVLFFGSGRVDDLEYYPDQRDYFFAVEETLDADGVPTGAGQLFHRDGPAAATAMAFDDGERLYGKPLIVAGKAILSTFVADPDKCEEGTGRVHIVDFDDVPDEVDDVIANSYFMASKGTPSAPAMVWTPTGPVVLIQQGKGVEAMPVADQIKTTAHALHWGQVL